MRIFTYAIITSVSLFAAGSVSPSPFTVVITQGGALAILGWAFWYILSQHLPKERQAFLEAQDKSRDEYVKLNKKTSNAIHRMAGAIEKLGEAINNGIRS